MTYKIEKNVPLPTRSSFSFDTMVPGDSFLVETPRERATAIGTARRLGLNVTSAKEGNKYRIWLLETKENEL